VRWQPRKPVLPTEKGTLGYGQQIVFKEVEQVSTSISVLENLLSFSQSIDMTVGGECAKSQIRREAQMVTQTSVCWTGSEYGSADHGVAEASAGEKEGKCP
jgi:hypothetical protein